MAHPRPKPKVEPPDTLIVYVNGEPVEAVLKGWGDAYWVLPDGTCLWWLVW
jgi:hypothetical protein